MMTRTTLKALWFGGGGILATWLAVTPNSGTPAASQPAEARRSASATQVTAQELSAQAARLRERTAEVTLRPSTRNPFRFSPPKPAVRSGSQDVLQPETVEPAVPPAVMGSTLTLSGLAQNAGRRTAIISGNGQIYLAGEGDSVAGRFIVITIDPEAVLLRESTGAEQRLVLPQ